MPPAVQAGYSARRWMCAVFLPYRVLAYSAGRPLAATVCHFLLCRGSAQNAHPLPNGKSIVFLPYRRALLDHLPSSAAAYCLHDTISRRYHSTEQNCAADFVSPHFLLCRAKQSRRDFVPTHYCAGGIPPENARTVPAVYFARPHRPRRTAQFLQDDTARRVLLFLPRVQCYSLTLAHAPAHALCRAARRFCA